MSRRPGAGERTAVAAIAHRGCAAQYPENTVFAARQSAPHVDMIEADVRRCRSGELVVFHDDDLGRLTGVEGDVAATDWATLRDLEVGDSGEPIPRLPELLAAIPPGTGVNLELKHAGMAEAVLSAADAVDNDVLYSSFSVAALRELRERRPDAPLAYVFADDPDAGIGTAADLGCRAAHPDHRLVDGALVAAAHDAGLAVNAWTVERRETVVGLLDSGVDGLILDRWDVLRR